jgi:hypothetical protein
MAVYIANSIWGRTVPSFNITDAQYMTVAKFPYTKSTQLSSLDILAIRQLYALVPDR